MLVYLHGMAENGTDLKAVRVPGAPDGSGTCEQWFERFIFIAPQCPVGKTWDARNCAYVKAIIDYEKKRLRIDGDRVCITGMSMGGYGTYAIVNLYPKYFAAANPIVGAGTWIKAPAVKHVPFWSFVTAKDPIVPIANCRATVDKLQAAGAYVRFTVFANLPHRLPCHRCWKDSFIFDWLLAQERGSPHNYHLAVVDATLQSPTNKSGDGFYEPKTMHKITARAPDTAKKEVFTGWTSSAGMGRFWVRRDYPKHKSTTHPAKGKGKFGNTRALTTTFTMPANDVIVTANYEINPNYKAPVAKTPVASATKPTSRPKRTDEDRARSLLALAKSYIGAGLKAKATDALKQLITKYPKTQAAKTAAAELEKLGIE